MKICLKAVLIQPEWELDGVNLLPYIAGSTPGVPHETLFWRYKAWSKKPGQDGWAVRHGDWMLLRNGWAGTPPALYNLAKDPKQRNDLSKSQPERYDELLRMWKAWDQSNVAPGSVLK